MFKFHMLEDFDLSEIQNFCVKKTFLKFFFLFSKILMRTQPLWTKRFKASENTAE